jgi:hypothetical protein
VNAAALSAKINRYRQFFAEERPGTLIQVACADHGQASHPKVLTAYDFSDPEDRQAWMDAIVDEAVTDGASHPFDDDHLPAAKILLGASISLLLRDRPLRQTGHGTTAEPVLKRIEDYRDWPALPEADNRWWKLVREARRHCEARGAVLPFVMPISRAGPLDLAFELRGPDLYAELVHRPDAVHGLLDAITAALLRIAEATQPETIDVETDVWVGGWGFNVCLPGHGGVLTADISCQLSEAMFREFELPRLQQIADRSPCYILHTHGAGKHHYTDYASIENVRMLQLVDDPNYPRAIDDLPAIFERVGLTPILINARPGEIRDRIDLIRQGRVVLRTQVVNDAEARRLMDFVRAQGGSGGKDGRV